MEPADRQVEIEQVRRAQQGDAEALDSLLATYNIMTWRERKDAEFRDA